MHVLRVVKHGASLEKESIEMKVFEQINKAINLGNQYKCAMALAVYKYLCDLQSQEMIKLEGSEEDIAALTEYDKDVVEHFQYKQGYFVAYENSFDSWVAAGSDFDVSNVNVATHAFERLATENLNKEHGTMVSMLRESLSTLGQTCGEQSAVLSKIIYFLNDMPALENEDELKLAMMLVENEYNTFSFK